MPLIGCSVDVDREGRTLLDEVEFEIRPFEGFGPVAFNMSRAEVQSILGDPDTELRDGTRLRFPTWGLFVDFDGEGRCEYIESYPPCIPVIEGLRLGGERWEVETLLASNGYRLCRRTGVEASTTECAEMGFALWGEEGKLEAIAAWRQGYWD